MRNIARAFLDALMVTRTIPVDRCYHFRGFRYGGFGNNPYEDYVVGVARGEDLNVLRSSFADVLINRRPSTMDEALQLDLGGWPLWHYPWAPARPRTAIDHPADNPDVVCHYCAAGVLASHINREFGWLERALSSIRAEGYRPSRFGYIRCLELRSGDQSSYIVLDGNHRISALHALGRRVVEVKVSRFRQVRREDVHRWPRVRDGSMSPENALKIFDRYFAATNPPLPRTEPARLIADETPLWSIAAVDLA